jgi:hypothetical protein
MKAPSTTSDVEMPSLALTSASAGPVPQRRRSRLTLASVVGRRWAASERQPSAKECSHPGKKTAMGWARGRPRRARAVLIWGLLWYAALHPVPLVLLHRSTEFPWHSVGEAFEARKWPKLRQLVAEDPDHPLLLMLGSSRACWAFRAGALDGMPDSDGRPLRVYNFGIPATGPIHELLSLRDLLAEGIRPRLVLIEWNPILLCADHCGPFNEESMMGIESISARRLLQWLPYFQRPGQRAYLWLRSRIAPWYTFRRQMTIEAEYLAQRQPCPTYEPIDDWGWHIPFSIPWPATERLGRLVLGYVNYYPELHHFRLGEKQTQALHELLDLCRREMIPAALVVMPESSLFRSWYSDEAKTQLRGLLDELSRTYGVAVIDANSWLAEDDFEDGHHALRHGADVFTSRLHAELPRLLAQSKARKSD